MPVVSRDTIGYVPTLLPVTGQRYTLGWQDAKQEGHCFVVVRMSVMREKILDRFPMTEDGWARAWAALVELDAGAAQAAAEVVGEWQAAHAPRIVEAERQAQVYEVFASAGAPTVFRSLDVQVLSGVGKVYTIGYDNPGTKTNTSRLLGPLAGAQAVITDGSQAWSPGRAMFLPIALTGLATKTKADAVVVFADGTVRTVALNGNNAVREGQKQAVQFNALAAASAPAGTETWSDPAAKLRKLQELRDSGLLTQEEYETKRAAVIDSI